MNYFISWLKSKNLTSHTVFALALVAAGVISSDSDVQKLLVDLLKAHPGIAADIILAAGVIAKYSHSSSPAGTLATARTINAQPDSPTAKEVNAADTTK